ncbi:GntR family transcriptional regulator [Neobacillus vireti]|uniref:GntR family transcriptional regulator n=1 Tax=Neobacillus vireti TaxID=220686 RepID=UPI001F43862D|nr:GntR family transcriptional regulator [Neobacillus vireti]
MPADEYLSEQLKIAEGEPVNMLERVRFVDEEPLQYEIAYLPWYKTPALNREACEKSLYNLLDTQYGLKINKTIESLELFIADEDSAEKLQIKIGNPCFALDTLAYLSDGTIIEYSKTIYRGDLAHFVIERNY